MFLRIREIIPYLDYDALVKDKIIPSDVFEECVNLPKKSAPGWAYKNRGPSAFGVFVEALVKQSLLGDEKEFESSLKTNYSEAYHSTTDAPDFKDAKTRGYVFGIYHFIKKELAPVLPNPIFEHEYVLKISQGCILGHPDIISSEVVYDVKASTNFESMRKDTILQLLSYYVLHAETTGKFLPVGIILPLNRKICVYTSPWDVRSFLRVLKNAAIDLLGSYNCLFFNKMIVGTHIKKTKTLCETIYQTMQLSDVPVPVQTFLSSPRKREFCSYKDDDVESCKQFCNENGARFYVHSPYYINLANPIMKDRSGKEDLTLIYLKHEMKLAARAGCSGVVVHIGSKKEVEKGKKIMYKCVKALLKFATESCPLLLETNAGEGNDLCCTVEELSEFYSLFDKQEQTRVKICVDTCHVFSCGYSPFSFLKSLDQYHPNCVKLVHFNDSRFPKGCRKDRHALVGQGYIGYALMSLVLHYCIQHKIDCVYE